MAYMTHYEPVTVNLDPSAGRLMSPRMAAKENLRRLSQALLDLEDEVVVLKAQRRELALLACAEGLNESEVARLAGVHRLTVRDWRGKRYKTVKA